MGHFDEPWTADQSLLDVDHNGWHNAASELFGSPSGPDLAAHVAAADPHTGYQREFLRNVRDYGAVGDNVADDSAAIQACIDAAPPSQAPHRTIYFPSGVYKLSGTLTLPSSSPRITLQGPSNMSTSPAAGAYLRQTSVNSNTFQVDRDNTTHTYVFEGLHIVYDSLGTGIGINLAVAADPYIVSSLRIKDVLIKLAGTGFKMAGAVGPQFHNMTLTSCGVGVDVRFSSGTDWNLAQFDHCYFNSNVTAGLRVSTNSGMYGPSFRNCVFESNTGPGILVEAGGHGIQRGMFDSCWWEHGSKGIVFKGGGQGLTFTNCTLTLDGDFLTIDAALGSGISLSHVNLIGCYVVLPGGKLMMHTAAHDADGTIDPHFANVNILGGVGSGYWKIKGLAVPSASPQQFSMFQASGIDDAAIEAHSVSGERPAYLLLNPFYANVYVDSSRRFIDFNEATADAAAGDTNHARLYARDNGSGKTQLCVRFNTGAVQVIATQP